MFHEDRQREIDRETLKADERRRFRAPPLNEDLPNDSLALWQMVPRTQEDFWREYEEMNRACHAIERLKDRNGIPEPQPTRYQWPTT